MYAVTKNSNIIQRRKDPGNGHSRDDIPDRESNWTENFDGEGNPGVNYRTDAWLWPVEDSRLVPGIQVYVFCV